MRNKGVLALRFMVFVSVLLVAAMSVAGSTTLPFEGEFYDTPYGSLGDEVYSMQFAIYDSPGGGTKLWPAGEAFETHPFVTVTRGRFSVLLGSQDYPITPNVHTGLEVHVQVGVCLPAGYECEGYEPLPLRLPLQTTATLGITSPAIGTPDVSSTPILVTPLPSITPPEAEVAESFVPIGIANYHTHWGETWSGSGTGLTLLSEGWGLVASTSSSSDYAVGLRGTASSSTGMTIGVWGATESESDGTIGVFGQAGKNLGLGFGVLGQTWSDNTLSAGVKGTATRGFGVLGIGDGAYDTSFGGYFTGWIGVYGEGSGMNAPGVKGISQVNTGIGIWGESTGLLGYASYFSAPRGTGIYVGEAGFDGIYILQAGDEGLEIHDAGDASTHLYPPDLEFGETSDGISIGGARDFGVWVGFAGRTGVGVARTNGFGYWVGDAGADGIRVESADQYGVSIGRAEMAGIHISHAGTSGIVIDNANLFGVHVSSQGAAGVHAESVRGPGGEFSSEESHALVVDGPALIGGRTPQQIGMLKWYEASELPNTLKTKSGPSGLAFDGQYIWVGHGNTGKILRLRASDGYKEETYGSVCNVGPIHDGLRLWFVHEGDGWFDLMGYNPREWNYGTSIYALVDPGVGVTAIAFDGRHMWVGTETGIYRFTITNESLTHLPSGISGSYETDWGSIKGAMFTPHRYNITCFALAFDGTYMWCANSGTNKVIKLHAQNMQSTGTYNVGESPIALAFDGANMWVANYGDGTVTKLRTSDGHTLGTYQVGKNPRALVFDGFNIWVANEGDDTLTKLRASDGALVGTYKTGRSPRALVFDGTHVWVANYLDDTLMKF